MEGLEVSEVRLSKVMKSSYSNRWDSTYFLKEFLTDEQKYYQWKSLSKLCYIKSGTTPKDRDENLKEGVILLKTNDIRNNVLLHGSDYFYIDEKCNKAMASSELKFGDVLINIVGATTEVVGRVAFVPKDFPKANITQAMSYLRLKEKTINPEILFLFLQTKYGINQTRRITRPTGQYNINNKELGSFKIPQFSSDFQSRIEQIVKSAHAKIAESKALYTEAEDALLSELGLKDWKSQKESVSIKSFSDFAKSGRLDSEYYQPKYDELEEKIKSFPHKTVAELQLFNARGVQPDYVIDGTVSIVNSKHILENGLDYENFEKTSLEFFNANDRAKIEKGDILIYTTGANIGRTQSYLRSEEALASNHVNILRLKEVNPIYAALVLNSKIGRLQTEKFCTGSAQAELYPYDIEKFIIPFLPESSQSSIAEKIQKSFSLHAESKRLLEQAKRMVEDEIEK